MTGLLVVAGEQRIAQRDPRGLVLADRLDHDVTRVEGVLHELHEAGRVGIDLPTRDQVRRLACSLQSRALVLEERKQSREVAGALLRGRVGRDGERVLIGHATHRIDRPRRSRGITR